MFKCNQKGWMTEELYEWLGEDLDGRPGAVLMKSVVEVLDAFKGHWTEKWTLSFLIQTEIHWPYQEAWTLSYYTFFNLVVNTLFKDYVTCTTNGYFQGTAH
jgi:hypothetical protein